MKDKHNAHLKQLQMEIRQLKMIPSEHARQTIAINELRIQNGIKAFTL